MKTEIHALTGAAIFDGSKLHQRQALLVQDRLIVGIIPQSEVPNKAHRVPLSGGTLVPGFVDLQVNGGGGVMLNDDPSVATLKRMAQAHARLGATSILPTLITDTPGTTRTAIAAVNSALTQGLAGIIGLHLEGPHLAMSRKGAHDGALIRPMMAEDLAMLCAAAQQLPVLKITLAPESATPEQMRALAKAGAILSLGHTDATFDQCVAATKAGVSCVTHLFNAMRPLGSREPGVVGAALGLGELSAGMIGDLIHVHPDTMRLAMAAKQGPGRIFLVSDAMAVAGTDIGTFSLNGREVSRRNGRLTLGDGTLAGADIDLAAAARNLTGIGVAPETALAMVTSRPAAVIGRQGDLGSLRPGNRADFVHLDAEMRLGAVWCGGLVLDQPPVKACCVQLSPIKRNTC